VGRSRSVLLCIAGSGRFLPRRRNFAVVEAAQSKAIAPRPRPLVGSRHPGRIGRCLRAGDKVTIAGRQGRDPRTSVPRRSNGVTINGKAHLRGQHRPGAHHPSGSWCTGNWRSAPRPSPTSTRATITLTNNVKDEQLMGMGDRGIMLSGGTLNLHGDRTNTWTKLANTAAAGSTSIEVLNAAQWRVGDEIVLASTDFDPRQARATHDLRHQRQHDHARQESWTTCTSARSPSTWMKRGEVGLLTRKHQSPGVTRRGADLSSAATSWRWSRATCMWRASSSLAWARNLTASLAIPIHWHLVGRRAGPVHQETRPIHDT